MKNAAAGTEVRKIGDFYASYMDEARLEQLGITPLKGELANIAAIKDKAGLSSEELIRRSLKGMITK